MGLRIVMGSLGLAFAAVAQAEPGRAPSPLRAVQEAPVASPRPDGLVVEVVSEKGRPVANAIVGVLPAAWTAEQTTALAALEVLHADDTNEWLAAVLLRFGERYRCDGDGRASVSPTAVHLAACDGALAGELVLGAATKGVARVTLLRPGALLARVVGPEGRPVVDQRVALVEGRFLRQVPVPTDARGECVLSLPPRGDRRETAVVALVAGASVRAPLPAGPLPRAPIELRLPPTGLLRVIAYDDKEQPRNDIVQVQLRWNDESSPLTVQPDAKGDVLVRAALGVKFVARVTLRATTGEVRAECVGPRRAGELVVCDVRATQGPPVLVFRVLGRDGRPVRGAGLRGRLGTGRSGGSQELDVGADGCVRLTLAPGFPCERLVITRRPPNLGRGVGDYLGAAIVALPKDLLAGDNVLSDVRLVEEPVVASGVVVDDVGTPLAGIAVGVQLVFGSEEPYHGDVEELRSDAEGRFEAREIRAATTVRLLTTMLPAGYELTSLDVVRGTRDARLVVCKQGRVHLRFVGVPDTEHELLYASLVPAGGAAAGRELRIRDGSAWAARPAGRYDLVLSLRRNDLEVVRFPDVVVQRGADTEDARLVPLPWREHLTPVTITAVDETGAPVVGTMVWCLFANPGGGEAGGGGSTDARGQFFALVPKGGARFRLVPEVRSQGPRYRVAELANVTTDQRLVLRAPLRVRLQLQGDRMVPGAESVRWRMQQRAAPAWDFIGRSGGANAQPTADGTWDLHYDAPGTFDVVMSIGVPEDEGRVRMRNVIWGTIQVVESGDVQTFRLEPDDAAKDELAELRRQLRK